MAIVSLVISLVFQRDEEFSWVDGVAILLTVLIVTVVSSLNTWSQEKQFQRLNEQQKDRPTIVIRNGAAKKISIFDIVAGDVVMLHPGDSIPADGICIESFGLQCDESMMTGDPYLVSKGADDDCFLLSGCIAQTGEGKMVVTCVGMNTQCGMARKMTLESAKERTETPLQKRLGDLADSIGKIGFVSAFIVLILLIGIWIAASIKEKNNGNEKAFSNWTLLLDYAIIAVTIVVVAVPEVW